MRFFAFCLILGMLAACKDGNESSSGQVPGSGEGSIAAEIRQRDSLINEYMRAINHIQANLDMIRQKENIITRNLSEKNIESGGEMAEQLVYDIQSIGQLLEQNRKKIKNLQEALKKSNIRISELEKLVENLALQLQEKDAQIANLQNEIIRLNDELKYLFDQYNQRVNELGETEAELNKAFYAFGTVKELKEAQIITKEGGFIGIGRAMKLKDDFNKSYFTQIDIREVFEIPLYAKKVEMLTVHPSGTFHFARNEKGIVEKLIIDNPKEFWSVSKYLVIVVE